ncbi:GH20160 [Drosophila grimshawi]|uniref:GH20160 n=2 Tax=Drosophila grimshawi TaxID=7222 RepID=B4J6G4_DROGR|nr:GH20160 [Drosophila grimshawi]
MPLETTSENKYGQVECVNALKETVSTVMIFYNAEIAFSDYTESALTITITQLLEPWTLIYFENPTITSEVEKHDDDVNQSAQTTLYIKDLSCGTSYVFCLMVEENRTSPFNCRSHQTLPCAILRLSWFAANSSLIIGLSIGGILLSVLIGLFAMYGVLWLRPHWLYGSKRLLRSESESHRMLLLPRSCEKDHYGAAA